MRMLVNAPSPSPISALNKERRAMTIEWIDCKTVKSVKDADGSEWFEKKVDLSLVAGTIKVLEGAVITQQPHELQLLSIQYFFNSQHDWSLQLQDLSTTPSTTTTTRRQWANKAVVVKLPGYGQQKSVR